MPSTSAKHEAVTFSIGVVYYLWLGTIFVPLSGQSYDSWAPFLKSWTIRLVVSVVFLALTRRVLKIGTVAAHRITPAPMELHPVEVPSPADGPTLAASLRPRPWPRWKTLLILSASVAAFAIRAARDAHTYLPLRLSPRPVAALLSAFVGSLCAAALVMLVMAVTLAWIQKPHVPQPNLRQKLFVGACLAYTAIYWLFHSELVARQPWLGQIPGRLAVGAIYLFAIACFAILWLPKPSDQPELLHVAPDTAEQQIRG